MKATVRVLVAWALIAALQTTVGLHIFSRLVARLNRLFYNLTLLYHSLG